MAMTRVVLVAVALCACGGDEASKHPAKDAGTDTAETHVERDAGRATVRDAGHDSGKSAAQGGNGGTNESTGGRGGKPDGTVAGGMAIGGSGGAPTNPQPEGGAGAPAQPVGSSQAPVEHVLWSQDWTVEVHEPVAYDAIEGDTMGFGLDAGQGCRFGNDGAPSGSTQTYETDGKCISAVSAAAVQAVFYGLDGKSHGVGGRMLLVGWKEAVTGHTVKSLRRTQTYTIQLLGSDNQRWDYADFTGKWEAVGF
jgi:hypothetical protein